MIRNKLYDTINELLRDFKVLATVSSNIRGTQIQSRCIEQFRYPIGGFIIERRRHAGESLQESFATTFIKRLYIDNEWENDALDEIPQAQWVMYLKDIWLPKYFNYKAFRGLNQYDFKDALNLILGYMLDGGLSETEYHLIKERYQNMEVVMIEKGYCDYMFVGVNDDYFIYSEVGIYD